MMNSHQPQLVLTMNGRIMAVKRIFVSFNKDRLMNWTAKFKLNRQLVRSLTEAGFTVPKEIQVKTLSRIIGGQDVIAIAPQGCGKTTTYVIGVLNRFNYQPEGVPQVLILLPSAEHVEQVIEHFNLLNKNKGIAIVDLHTAGNVETQMAALAVFLNAPLL